jgi:DNA topoisomerase IB
MLAEVSDHLGNTPTVARNSYVDPRVSGSVVRLLSDAG